MQAVQFLSRAVALHPRKTGVDHVVDARHGQRGFRNIRRQHDAPLRAGIEHPVLVARRQPGVQRQHLGVAILALLQRLMRIADFALAGQENQRVAHAAHARDLVAGRHDAVQHRTPAFARIAFAVVIPAACIERPIAHIDRIAAAFHAHHRRVAEVLRKTLGVDRRGGDDHLQIAALDQQLLEIAEQEIDVETALVRFVDDDGVVGRQPAVGLDFGQQNAVGHELDRRLLADVVVEAHLIADQCAERRLQLFRYAPRDRARGNPARLGAADHAGGAATGGQAELRQLRGLARTGFARNHHHLMIADQRDDAFALACDGQGGIDLERLRKRRRTGLACRHRSGQRIGEGGLRRGIAGLCAPARPQPKQPSTVARQPAVDRPPCALQRAVVRFTGRSACLRGFDHRALSLGSEKQISNGTWRTIV